MLNFLKTYLAVILGLSVNNYNYGQSDNCPPGYKLQQVKCGLKYEMRCVPDKIEGKYFWNARLKYRNRTTGEGLVSGNTYEEAEKNASRRVGKPFPNDWDYYEIYLDGQLAGLCNASIEKAIAFKNKNFRTVEAWLLRLKNYRDFYKNQPYIPGSVMAEYSDAMDLAYQQATGLRDMMQNMNERTFPEIENTFNDVERKSRNWDQQFSTYKQNVETQKRSQNSAYTPNGNTSYNTANNYTETNRKTEQDRQKERNLELEKRQQESVNMQLREIERKSIRQASNINLISDGLSNLTNYLIKRSAEKKINEDKRERNQRFNYLKEKVSSGDYEINDCNSCDGEGYNDCSSCKSHGTTKCSVCNGTAGSECSKCDGNGSYQIGSQTLTCISCLGKGVKSCTFCSNTGEMPCLKCEGIGEIQCLNCRGTGQELKKVFKNTESYYSIQQNTSKENKSNPINTSKINEDYSKPDKSNNEVAINKSIIVPPKITELEELKTKADKGDNISQYNLGDKYYKGEDVEVDKTQALYWFKKAAEGGNTNSYYNLGYMYDNGEGTTIDKKQALFWYKKAAEKGNVDAEFSIGKLYYKGAGITQDKKQASYWLKRAAENGSEEAQNIYIKINPLHEIPAAFSGGIKGWINYLSNNLNTEIAINNGAPIGKYIVIVNFKIDPNGYISSVKAVNDPGFGTKEEAIRVIKNSPKWKPAIVNGRKVIYNHKQSISFIVSEEE